MGVTPEEGRAIGWRRFRVVKHEVVAGHLTEPYTKLIHVHLQVDHAKLPVHRGPDVQGDQGCIGRVVFEVQD